MPQYDFRCKKCQLRFSISYRSYAEYDAATRACPDCASAELSRLIKDVALRRQGRDYGKMTSREMLSVLESGDQQQVREMYLQVGGAGPADPGQSKSDEPKDGPITRESD